MKIFENLRNTQAYPQNDAELTALRENKWAVYTIPSPTRLEIREQAFYFREGLTFTPFANPVPCNAHCRFCSEELQKKENHQLTAQRYIKDYNQYFEGLEKALLTIKSLHVGLSLSGLEATAEPTWLLRLLDVLEKIKPTFQFDEKVLYTNGSGLFKHTTLVNALKNSGFDRIELSRCHPQQAINQSIMYFNRNEPIWQNESYETLVKSLHGQLFVKNSCILTQKGTKNVEDIEAYLHWAIDLGVKEVVFRELSRLDDSYLPNQTAKWVAENRVLIEPLLQEVAPQHSQARKNWEYLYSTVGYYYYNEHYRYKNQIEVILETSSYPALENANDTGTIQKMVFHSNGNLCGSWNPDANVIAHFFDKLT
jgi:molybdenum cofactor biosynthesis enzyme MoaA